MRPLRILASLNFAAGLYFAATLAAFAYTGLRADSDFTAIYTGWRIALSPDRARLYDLDTQRRHQREVAPSEDILNADQGGLTPYINPPHWTLPLAPLALLPREVSSRVWLALLLSASVCSTVLLWRMAAGWSLAERVYLLSAVAGFYPLSYALAVGAFSPLVLLSLTLYHLRVRADSSRAGLWLAVGTVKPQGVLLPALIPAALRRWHVLVAFAAACSALAGLATALMGWQVFPSYLRLLRVVGGSFNAFAVYPDQMCNFKALLTITLGAEHKGLINALALIGFAAAALYAYRLWRGGPDFHAAFALTVMLSLFFSPHTHNVEATVAVLPCVLLYDRLRREGRCRAFGAFLLAAPFAIFLAQLAPDLAVGRRTVLLFILILTAWAWREVVVTRAWPPARTS